MSERVTRRVWFLLLCTMLLLLGLQLHQGLRIDTRFAAMTPVPDGQQELKAALAAAREQADQRIMLLLSSSDQSQLEAASAALLSRLEAHADLLSVSSSGALPASTLALLVSHRFQLLGENQRQMLLSEQPDALLADTLSRLYSPAGEYRLLEFNADPFNTLGVFIEQQLDRHRPATTAQQRLINLSLLSGSQERRAQQTLHTLFAELDSLLAAQYPQVSLARSGVYFFASHAANAAKKDINFISGGSMLGMLILLLLVFRSLWPMMIPLASIVSGVVSAFAIVHALYGSVHVFTIVFGASLIGIVIDYSIHYFYHTATDRNASTESATVSGKGASPALLRALQVSLLTSIVGFAALALAGLELLQKIAVFSVCGVAAAWLSVLALAPLVERRVLVRASLLEVLDAALHRLAEYTSRLFRPLQWLSLAAIALALVSLFARGQDDPRQFVTLPQALLAESQAVASAFQGIEPGRFVLLSATDEQTVFDLLNQLYADYGNPRELQSLLDWLPSPQQQRQNYQLAGALYAEDALASKLYSALQIDVSGLADLHRAYRDAAGKILSADALFSSAPQTLPALLRRSAEGYFAYVFIRSGADHAALQSIAARTEGVEYIDSVAQSIAELRHQRQRSVAMLVLAYIGVGLLLVLLYRRLRSVTMLLLPATATLLTVAILSVCGVAFSLFHTMALFLILGLGMDYAVFLSEMKSGRQATLQAIQLSALTTMLSFGLLSLSSVPVAQAFGLTVLLGNSMNLLMAFALSRTKLNG